MKTSAPNKECTYCGRIGYWYESNKVVITELVAIDPYQETKYFDGCDFCCSRHQVDSLTVMYRENTVTAC